jgi:decaprenyl-phosphate phosphoribosyltransferase
MSAVGLSRAFLVEARPRQWLKNVLVFAGPAAAGLLTDASAVRNSILVFIGFCLAASGTYFLNDVIDREFDRRHPTKKHRPIASGIISAPIALVTATVLLLLGCGIAAIPRWQSGAVVAVYGLVTISYSVYLKTVPILELAFIAAGFVLRAMAGAAATQTPMSTWFLLSITFGSFYVASGKRFAESLEFGREAVQTREAQSAYSLTYLRQLIAFACSATAISYSLWAFENASLASSNLPLFELSIVPMVLALLRYLMVLEAGRGGAPEDVFLTDRAIQVYASMWLVIYVLGVYAG